MEVGMSMKEIQKQNQNQKWPDSVWLRLFMENNEKCKHPSHLSRMSGSLFLHIIYDSNRPIEPESLMVSALYRSMGWRFTASLRKHAYSNILKILPSKTESFQKKNLIFSYFWTKHRLCVFLEPPRRGGSNGYQQSTFWAEIRKIMYTPVNPSFTIWKGV